MQDVFYLPLKYFEHHLLFSSTGQMQLSALVALVKLDLPKAKCENLEFFLGLAALSSHSDAGTSPCFTTDQSGVLTVHASAFLEGIQHSVHTLNVYEIL